MGLFARVRRRRVLGAFLAGALLTLVVVAAAGYWILSDQRRSAQALAAALSRALAREVRIDRVSDMGTARVVMRGVELPREGGWPATVRVERLEATGPLLSAARGDPAPVRLVVTRPTVELPAGGGGGGLIAAVAGLGETLRGLLTNPLLLDVSLSGGRATSPTMASEFELSLLKSRGEARGTLVLHAASGPPLTLTFDGRLDGQTAHVGLAAQGGLGPLAALMIEPAAAVVRTRTLELRVDADLGAPGTLTARGRLAMGDALAADGTASVKDGALELALTRAHLDLGFAAPLIGLGWRPTGRAELSDVSVAWRPEGGGGPTVRGLVSLPTVTVPAAAAGTEIAAEGVESRLALVPGPSGFALTGEARAIRLRVAGLDIAPAESRYRLSLDPGFRLVRADLDALQARVEAAALQGAVGYDAAARRLEARLAGEEVDVGALVRKLGSDWLASGDQLRLLGLRLTATGLDAQDFRQGSARLEARGLRLVRADGQVTGGRLAGRADLAAASTTAALEAERLTSTLPVLPGEIPQLSATADLARGRDGAVSPTRAALTARDREGREMVVATLVPAATAGRLTLSARVPALERLDGLWTDVPRRLGGSARLDVELTEGSPRGADGRLTVSVTEGELWKGKVSLREVEADVPVRQALPAAGEPRWGRLAIGELIGYGVVVRDLTTPARLWGDRLSLNQLAYVLYSGEGGGWGEIELGPAGLAAKGHLSGSRVRVEEFIAAYGIRGGTMTGLLRYELDYQYRAGRLALNGRFEVPEGGTVNIELLNRLLAYADVDATGLVRQALHNLRGFDYKHATAEVRSVGGEIMVSLSLQGREQYLIFPPKVREINIQNMPLSFLARQFPGS
jgi:hypothetical protein